MDTQQGPAAEFAELLRTHQSRLFGYIHSLVRDLNDADELFQQTAVILWSKLDGFDRSKSFLSWACGIARLEAFNFLRSRGRRRLYFSDELNLLLIEAHEDLGEDESAERREALGHCLAKLRERDRRLVEECYDPGAAAPEPPAAPPQFAALAEIPPGRPLRFVLVGDLHFGTAKEAGAADFFRGAARLLPELGDVAFVVMLGDVVDNGSNPGHWSGLAALPEARAFFEDCRRREAPVFPIIGNHEPLGYARRPGTPPPDPAVARQFGRHQSLLFFEDVFVRNRARLGHPPDRTAPGEQWYSFHHYLLSKIVAAEYKGPDGAFEPRREVTVHTGHIMDSAEEIVPPVQDTPLTIDGVASGTILVQPPVPVKKGCLASLVVLVTLLGAAGWAVAALRGWH